MKNQNYLQSIEAGIRRELSEICNCTPDTLPVSLSPEQSTEYFHLTNRKTLNVWHSTGRHGLVWIRRGRRSEIATESAIQHRLKSVVIPSNAA